MNDTSPRDDAPPSPSAAGKGKTGQFRAGDLVLFKEGDDRTPALILDVVDEDEEETLYTLEYVGWRRSWNTDEAASTLCSRRPGSTTHKRTLLLINNTRAIVAAIEKARKGKPYRISDWVEVPGWGVGKVIDKCFRPVPHAPGTYHLSYYVKFALKKQEKFDNWVTNAQIKRTVAAPAKAKGGRGDVFNECTEPDDVECEDLDDLDKLRHLCDALASGTSPERRNEFEVERILDRRKASGDGSGYEYKVQWARSAEETWEPESNLENATEQIEEWKTRRRAEKQQAKAKAKLKQEAFLKSQQQEAAAKATKAAAKKSLADVANKSFGGIASNRGANLARKRWEFAPTQLRRERLFRF